MIPRCFPTNADGYWLIFEIDSTDLVPWVDFIPVADRGGTAASRDEYGDPVTTGWYKAELLLDDTGLVAWVDYTPVDFLFSDGVHSGTSDDTGHIPIWTP